MKVNGPRPATGPSGPKKASGSSASGFAPAGAGASPGSAPVSPLAASSAIGSVDALLALQGTGDFREAKKQATDRAFSILDILDDLKIALLEGAIARDTLVRLLETVKSERNQTGDPRLEAALNEVELRAVVELAKHDV